MTPEPSMNYEHQKLQRALKALMKKNRLTYQSIGSALDLSTATVKRRLNGEDITINQLKEFAEILSVSFYELIELSKAEGTKPHLFTPEQEGILSTHIHYILSFRLVLAGRNFSQIRVSLNLNERQFRKILRELERVNLVRLMPQDRIVATVRFPFKWQPRGALSQTYNKHILQTIMKRIASDKGTAGVNRKFEIALPPDSYRAFCADVESVYLRYRNLSEVILGAKVEHDHIVSGLFFIDNFSVWGDEGESA